MFTKPGRVIQFLVFGIIPVLYLQTMASKSLSDLKQLQRHQIKALTKDELIDCILANNQPEEDAYTALTTKIDALVNEVTELRNIITSPESVVNKKTV